MQRKKILSTIFLTLMIFMSVAPPVALAQDSTEPTVEPAPAAEPTPEPEPQPEPAPTTTNQEPAAPSTSNTGPTQPTGPSGPTGVIPNYAFDSKISKWVPTKQDTFYWNGSRWTSPYYTYNSQNGWYYVNHSYVPPAATTSSSTLAPSDSGTSDPTQTAEFNETKAALAQLLGLSDPSISNTGAGSTNIGTLNNSTDFLLNVLTQASINNSQTSSATSGDATVTGNTIGGSAVSGMASVVSNFLNLINSAWSWSSGNLSYFLGNFFGDHKGDVMLSPTNSGGTGGSIGCFFCTGGTLNTVNNTGANSANTATTNADTNIGINYQPTGTITNNIDLLAQSGNATVSGNTQAGDAISGDAIIELNIINMINSAISSGGSFFGMLNIFGNLNGDILFPDGFLTGLLAGASGTGTNTQASVSNTGPNSTNTATSNSNFNGTITDSSQSTFNNNIDTDAQSGNAEVSSNTSAGSATTGSATTNTNTYNLYNAGVSGSNAVLVLVNVLGTWVGMVMDVPSYGGSTSAFLGGNAVLDVSNTGPNSTNTATSNTNTNVDINYAPTSTISNNINAGAISGNASVVNNTSGGNATSGNASVAANVVNIMGSNIDLTNWFGVLVINVFGNWFGSVGKDTDAGTLGIGGSSLALSLPSSSSPAKKSTSTALSPLSVSTNGTPLSADAGSASSTDSNVSKIKLASASNVARAAAAKKSSAGTSMLLILTAAVLLGSGGMLTLSRKLSRG